ncbi:MAG: NCS1 family nucleobase:cation symporter-1, partial [Glutamicibacter protophormiae]
MAQNTPQASPAVPAESGHERSGIDRANPYELSPSLYNQDLAPTTRSGRTWSAYSIFTLWA